MGCSSDCDCNCSSKDPSLYHNYNIYHRDYFNNSSEEDKKSISTTKKELDKLNNQLGQMLKFMNEYSDSDSSNSSDIKIKHKHKKKNVNKNHNHNNNKNINNKFTKTFSGNMYKNNNHNLNTNNNNIYNYNNNYQTNKSNKNLNKKKSYQKHSHNHGNFNDIISNNGKEKKSHFNNNINNLNINTKESIPGESAQTVVSPYKTSSSFFHFNKKSKLNGLNLYSADNIKKRILSLQNEVQINKLKINLIFFYEVMSEENFNLYNLLKLEVIGGFYGVQDINILMNLFNKIYNINSPFILISTGTSFEKIKDICIQLNFLKYIIIFCLDKRRHNHFLYDTNGKVKLISNDIEEIYYFLHAIKFPGYDNNLNRLINHCNIISFYEYINYYYIYHKILSFYFKDDLSELKFSSDYVKKVFNFIEYNTNYNSVQKSNFKNEIIKLHKSNNFVFDVIKFYTTEHDEDYIYLFLKNMREFYLGFARLSFLIGPMYYSLIRFLYNNGSNFILTRDTLLYRTITINPYELNTYYMAINNIICFPAFSSCQLKLNFETTNNAKKVNNINDKEAIKLVMKLKYFYQQNTAPPGIYIGNISNFKSEEEYLLFPFTFIKVNYLRKVKNKLYELSGIIINKDCMLEFGLRNGGNVTIKNGLLTLE